MGRRACYRRSDRYGLKETRFESEAERKWFQFTEGLSFIGCCLIMLLIVWGIIIGF